MNDIAKCAGVFCQVKETCKRFTTSISENEGYSDVESQYWVYPKNKVSVVEKKEDCSVFYPNPPVLPAFPKNSNKIEKH